MAKKLEMTGTVCYFHGMERPTNVTFDGDVTQDGKTTKWTCIHVEEILRHRVCTHAQGNPGKKVRITVEFDD